MSLRSVCNTLIGNLLVFGLLNYALAQKPKLLDGDLIHVHTTFEGAAIHDRPYAKSNITRDSEWLEHFVVIKEEKDRWGVHWVRVGDFVSLNKTNPKGWIKKDDLLMNQTALKVKGIYQKVIVKVSWDELSKEIDGAKRRKAPLSDEKYVYGQTLTISDIHYVYAAREDLLTEETFILIGRDPDIRNPGKPELTILGWVHDKMLFEWHTRFAAEYDKSTYPREGAKIYETSQDVEAVIRQDKGAGKIEEIAYEDTTKKIIRPEDPRFPIISQEREIEGIPVWEIGFIGDQIVDGNWVTSASSADIDELRRTTWTNPVDVLFVFDGTGSMIVYKDAVISAVNQLQEGITTNWASKHSGETKATVRFSATMYKDYIELDNFKRIPFTDDPNIIEQFIQNHDFSGGFNEPAVFNGIAETLSAAGGEFDKNSIRVLILIGDMGNLGSNYTSADPRGHTVETIASQLFNNQCDFYTIHVANVSDYYPEIQPAVNSFESQSKSIMENLDQELSGHFKLVNPQHVKDQIVDKLVTIIEQRYATGEVIVDIASGIRRIGSGNLTGTILEKRAINIMIQHGIDPNDFVNKNVTPFGEGWVLVEDRNSGKQLFKDVVLMDKEEVERLISLLGQMTSKVSYSNVSQGWMAALENETGDEVSMLDNPAAIMSKHLGIPIRSGVLSMSFNEISLLPASRITETIKEFERKLFLLRAVNNEEEIKITEDKDGFQNWNVVGSKKWWFGTIGNQRVWLDTEIYMP